jgi:hypothetical protein
MSGLLALRTGEGQLEAVGDSSRTVWGAEAEVVSLTPADAVRVVLVSAALILVLLWTSPPGRSWLQEIQGLLELLLALAALYIALSHGAE